MIYRWKVRDLEGRPPEKENTLTNGSDMWEHNPTRITIEHALHESIAAFIGYTYKRRQGCKMSRQADLAGSVEGEGRMLEVDEEGVVACGESNIDDIDGGDELHAKGL